VIRRFETHSFPSSLAATLRGLTFYLADPVNSIHRLAPGFLVPFRVLGIFSAKKLRELLEREPNMESVRNNANDASNRC